MGEKRNREEAAVERSVLIVEDDSHTRRVLALLLELRGYRVVEAEDGRAGLELALDDDVDLVVSDLQLPGISGLDLARALHERDGIAPVVAITSGPKALVRAARESRLFSRVLRKPIDANEILALIDDLSGPGRPGSEAR